MSRLPANISRNASFSAPSHMNLKTAAPKKDGATEFGKFLGGVLFMAILAAIAYGALFHTGAFLVIGMGCGVLLAVAKLFKVITQ